MLNKYTNTLPNKISMVSNAYVAHIYSLLTEVFPLLERFLGLPRPFLATGSPFSPSFTTFFSALSVLTGLPRFFISLISLSLAYIT